MIYKAITQIKIQLMQNQTYTQIHFKDIVDKRISQNSICQEHTYQFRGRTYLIYPHVFSPVFFPNTSWFTNTLLDTMPQVQAFLEIGTGAGYALAEALLSGRCKRAVGSDISQQAINNAKVNLNRLQLDAELVVSDVLEGINRSQKFDLIYWNYPFNHNFGKLYEDMNVIEQAARDPNYRHLDKLLATAKGYLNLQGFLIMSFSLVIGNVQLLEQLTSKHGWIYSVLVERPADQSQNLPHLCLLKLIPAQ